MQRNKNQEGDTFSHIWCNPGVCVCVMFGCIYALCVVRFAKCLLQANVDAGSLDLSLLTVLINTGPVLFHIVKWRVEVNEWENEQLPLPILKVSFQ